MEQRMNNLFEGTKTEILINILMFILDMFGVLIMFIFKFIGCLFEAWLESPDSDNTECEEISYYKNGEYTHYDKTDWNK